MQYTKDQKIAVYKTLPEDLQEAIMSTESAEKFQSIAKKHSLMFDQTAELADETGLVMIGMTRVNQFVPNLVKRLNIDSSRANAIAQDINAEIFDSIRASLQKIQTEDTDQRISDIEKAGGFTIEEQPQTLESAADMPTSQQGMDREKILSGIENPKFNNNLPINVLDSNSLADHMLSGTVAKPMTTTEIKLTPTPSPATPPAPPAPPKPDPYREPIV